jgi:hypothetical protein
MPRTALLALLLVASLASPALAVAPVPADRTVANPAGWAWYYNASGATISTYLAANPGLRLADLRRTAAGTSFDAAFIANSGEYAVSGWWWYYDVTIAQISSALTTNQARLLTLNRYVVSGQVRYCCVMVRNTGAEARGWWWLLDVTPAQLGSFVSSNNARIFQLQSYDAGGGTRLYDALLVSNTGSDALGWYYFMGQTTTQYYAFINANDVRPIDMSAYTDGVGTIYLDNVMIANTGAQAARWKQWIGVPTGDLGAYAATFGSRIQTHQSYAPGLSVAITVNVEDAATERIGNLLRWGWDGTTGCYFKRINGPVSTAYNERFAFEPASAIKPLAAIHLMRRWDAGTENLAAAANYYTAMTGSCPLDATLTASTERKLLWLMLKNSDNSATQWFRKRYGNEALNATASTLGMTATAWHHRIGCADSALAVPNRLTLVDIGTLQEKIMLAQACSAAARDTLHEYFVNESNGTSLQSLIFAVVDDEAGKLGLNSAIRSEFKAAFRYHYKQGGYGLSTGGPSWYDRSAAGWVYLPTCATSFQQGVEYVFGSFVEEASNDSSAANRSFRAISEMMRDAIRQALGACPLAVEEPLHPDGFELSAPAPNPARGATTLRYRLPYATRVRFEVVDVGGREVATLLEAVQSPGEHSLAWDGRAAGRAVAPGTYFVRMRAGTAQRVERLTVVR